MDAEANRRYSIWILVIFVLVGVFIIAWGMFLDKGKLIIDLEAPYKIDILAGPEQNCVQDLCEFELKPGTYKVVINKENYYAYEAQVEVLRWEDSVYKPELSYIPQIVSRGEKEKTEDAAKDSYAYLANDPQQNKQALFLHEYDEARILSYFPRALKNPQAQLSKDNKMVAIFDNNEEESSIYFVAVKSTKKQKIATKKGKILAAKWSPENDKILINLYDKGEKSTEVIWENGRSLKIPFNEKIEFYDWFDNENLVIASSETGYEENTEELTIEDILEINNNLNVTIEDGELVEVPLEESEEDTAEEVIEEKTMYFYMYNLENQNTLTLASITGDLKQATNIEVKNVEGSNRIYFVDKNNELNEILLEAE